MSDPAFLSASAAAAALATGELTSRALIEALLARIEAHDAKLHAFTAVYGDDARLAADAADSARRAGHAVGPWHGVPIALKDIIDLEGRITMGGSKHWAERVSGETAVLAKHLIAAGLIVLGKTHTVEFAMGGWGTNTRMGTPWNPWDLDTHRAPGGSSSGSGVATAARMAPWAIGTDTGGSVRLPASWNGLTGLKTTVGRVSIDGVLPLAPTMDTPGPMARDVEDAAALYVLLQGPGGNDPRPQLRKGVAGLRLGTLNEAERGGVADDVLAAYDKAVETLTSLGAACEPLTLPLSTMDSGSFVGRLIGSEGYSFVGKLVDDESLPLDDDVRPRIRLGADISAADYLALLRQREEHKRQALAALDGFDAWLTPTTETAAPPIDTIDQSATPARFTRPVNWLDWCALALPDGASGGLPLSLQIVCRGNDEATALRIGWAYQQATDWHTRVPAGLEK
jgi:aspartyl-tRNA(Asn)/glutamyl-tRNA(Gln) amidotransferase subunit A